MKNKRMLKAITFATLLAIPVLSQAAVNTQTMEDGILKISYPVVQTANVQAQEAINNSIQAGIKRLKAHYAENKKELVADQLNYKVAYEDDSLVSLIFTHYFMNKGAAHGMTHTMGVVYDKKTGQQLPLEYFLHVSMPQIYEGITSGTLGFYNGSFQPLQFKSDLGWTKNIKDVPKSYLLNGNGAISLIFQPYDLAPYSDGTTYVQLKREDVNRYNQLYKK